MRNHKRIELLVIDGQNDFCGPNGALFVAGADKDMVCLAEFVKQNGAKLADINVTLDSHHPVHVAHPCFWRNCNGENPQPFTIISAKDVMTGVWTPTIPAKGLWDRMVDYVKKLEAGGRYPLCVWPPHCLIGSWGHNIYPPLFDAICQWETCNFATVTIITKGSSPFAEHYSAIKAEAPDPRDETTQLNVAFVEKLKACDVILIAGEPLSHTVANTVRDLADAFGDDRLVGKLVLLSDATSSVTGFDALGTAFVQEMIARGMQVTTTKDFRF
jgi:nicotinamidase-related amidase